MSRILCIVAAMVIATISVTAAGLARLVEPIRFTLAPSRTPGSVQVDLRSADSNGHHHSGSSFVAAHLTGLDLSALRAPGSRPLAFALVREAGRLDCSGSGGGGKATGECRFAPDAAFADELARRGIGRPDREDSFHLTMVGATRDLAQALADAGYAMPDVDDFTAMAAVGVTRRYIADLAARGYRPRQTSSLIEFRALGVTPDYVDGLRRAGYAALDADMIVQFKALGITPEFVAGFGRIGYRDLPPSKLVELKALGVTPEFVRAVQGERPELPSTDKLVRLRAAGFRARGERRD